MLWNRSSHRRALSIAAVLLGAIASLAGCSDGSTGSEGDGVTDGGGGSGANGGGAGGMVDTSTCGNGTVEQGEDCDDQNEDQWDGCGNDCFFTCEQTLAGDQKCNDALPCNGHETCGPDHKCLPGTPPPDYTRCGESHVCIGGTCTHIDDNCGDGVVTGNEQCEDGNTDNGDGCDNDCLWSCDITPGGRACAPPTTCYVSPTCDGTTHSCSFEQLADLTPCNLDPNDPSAGTGACVASVCRSEYCGDNATQSDLNEECDDGNTASGDGCEPDCKFSCLSTDSARNCVPNNPCLENAGCDDSTHICPASTVLPNATTCGTQQVCVYGICRKTDCGDGVVDTGAGEDCDDANNINGDGCDTDCKYSCSQNADCAGTLPSACLKWTCGGDHQCHMSADSSRDGQACSTTNASGTTTSGNCATGACTAGTCGNGVVDAGEQCDPATPTASGEGCEPGLCVYSCQTNSDCNNGEVCDGTEVCRTINVSTGQIKKCATSQTNQGLDEGAVCNATTGAICENDVCRQSVCGDLYTDQNAGETCEPPNTDVCDGSCHTIVTCDLSGTWATHILVEVSWQSPFLVASAETPPPPYTHYIEQTVMVNIQHDPTSLTPLSFTQTIMPCSLATPDFATTQAYGNGDVYGTIFPNSIWDNGVTPTDTTGTLSGLSPGSTVTVASSAVVTGINLGSNPFIAWPDPDPSSASYVPYDQILNMTIDEDEDGQRGITTLVKPSDTPGDPALLAFSNVGTYENVLVDLATSARADQLYLAVRQISSETGTIDSPSCDHMSGTLSVTSIDNHIVGCHLDQPSFQLTGRTECNSDEASFADFGRPHFKIVSATFESTKIADGASCQDVRAAYP